MSTPCPRLYIFGWPGEVGGVETKLAHLLDLLHKEFVITVVPPYSECLNLKKWTSYMDFLGVSYLPFDQCRPQRGDIALSLGNLGFFTSGECGTATNLGMKIVWSYECVWPYAIAESYIRSTIIDKVLFVSEFQKNYSNLPREQAWCITENYVNPARFPILRERRPEDPVTVGRLSRADPDKYPEDFPKGYESFGKNVARFRVMAWDKDLSDKYADHCFGERWDLLEALSESTVDFLNSLDLFVYDPGSLLESWGRSTVEAMLCGAVPIVPTGHHFDKLVLDKECGFLCRNQTEFKRAVEELSQDGQTRSRFSRLARQYAEEQLCDRKQHIERWKHALLDF